MDGEKDTYGPGSRDKHKRKAMNQQTQPWEEPLDDSYWQALLEEEPQSPLAGSEEETWEEVGFLSQEATHEETAPSHSELEPAGAWQQQQTRWAEMRRCFDAGEVLELEVVGHNRGGILVDCERLQGFVPASQLVGFKHTSGEDRSTQLSELVGQRLRLKIIELDQDWNRLILSERAAESGAGSPKEILDQLRPGEVCDGWITNLCPFGAFVDLGGVEGLIHISELSWGRVESPHEVLSTGNKVQVYVLNVDRERHRVGLSLKRLRPNPWSSVEENYQVGQLVAGRVTNVVDFGAFVRIEEGLEGLIHVSELAEGSFLHPRNVVQEGEEVTVRIIRIDSHNHRLGLSIRQV
jgi:small subunit ribosomal protein S1